MVGELTRIAAHGFYAFSEGGFRPGLRRVVLCGAPEFVGRENDVAVDGVAGEDVAILVGAEDGEGAEQRGTVVVVDDGFQRGFQLAAGGEAFNQPHQIGTHVGRATRLRYCRFPEEVRGIALRAEDVEGGVGEEDGEEGVGEDFQDTGGVDGVGMSGGGESEVCLVLELQDYFGE